MQHKNYSTLLSKLDQFIRKFYLNKIIRGALYSTAILVVLFLAFTLLENYTFNSTLSSKSFRKILFYTFTFVSGFTLLSLVILPIFQYFKLGKHLSYERAAQIIGQHFQEIDDKLLNTLQLHSKAKKSTENSALLLASINQKIEKLNPIPFRKAIDLSQNKRYLPYALPPLLLLLILLLSSNMIEDSTNRIINNSKEFERQALFSFSLKEENPKVVQYENYDLTVFIEGEALPAEVFIELNNHQYKLEKVAANEFKYSFIEIAKDIKFRLRANGFSSKEHFIDVLEKPQMTAFDVKLDYPKYTNRIDEKVNGVGDLVIPQGTKIQWLFEAIHASEVSVKLPGKELIKAQAKSNSIYELSQQIKSAGNYTIYMKNDEVPQGDSVRYSLTVIPDLYPDIEVKSSKDSLNDKLIYFVGEASDDYGIRRLDFHYSIEREGEIVKEDKVNLTIESLKQTTYEHMFNVRSLDIQPGDKLQYYFQVWDNDAVNGSKSAKTPAMYYEVLSKEELAQLEEENDNQIKEDVEEAMKKLEKLGEEVRKVRENILQKQKLNWQDRRELEKLIQERKEIENQLENAQENFQQNLENQEEFQEQNKELQEKQEQLQKLFDEVMNDELKEMFEEMEDLLKEMNQEEILEKLEDIQLSEHELEKEMDRMLELFKKMEVEKEMMDAMEELEELAKEQEKLAKENEEQQLEEQGKDDKNGNEEKEMSVEEIQKKQEELNKAFEELKDKIEKAEEKNKDLENPMDMDMEGLNEQIEEIQEEMQNSSQQMQNKQQKNAAKSQKNAAEKMKQMSKKMQQMMQMQQMQKMEQDMKSMRQLLENLVMLSLDQEKLIAEVNLTMPRTPTYVRLVQEQYKIKDDFRYVEDSLHALSKRVFQLEAFITEKVTDVKKTLGKSLKNMEERIKHKAVVEQQYTMTGLNDLALMLSESMDQMQQQMAEQMPGEQMCEKPGGQQPGQEGQGMGKGKGKGKKPGMGELRKMQQKLSDQIQQMKNGQMPGSKEFAKMAAKQAAIRKAIQDMKKEQKGKGGGKELQDLINQMDEVETDLVNKRLPNDILKRQQDILTRLLEAENAEREREYDNKRKAEQPEKYEPRMPVALEEYLKKRKGQVEMFKTVSPSLKPYYKNLVERYFRALK